MPCLREHLQVSPTPACTLQLCKLCSHVALRPAPRDEPRFANDIREFGQKICDDGGKLRATTHASLERIA